MCGIAGFIAPLHHRPTPTQGTLARLRDAMAHRGPDGSGLWESPQHHVQLAHRRLAVLDPTPAGAQPFTLSQNNKLLGVLAYNGELYNDLDLRDRLSREHATRFHTHCDTETLAATLDHYGPRALPMLRGMFAFAWYDATRETLLLARDPLGIKPLYWWRSPSATHPELAFASELRPLLLHPSISSQPDLVTVSSYLTTIRTTLATRTLYKDIRTLEPGDWIEFDLRDAAIRETRGRTSVRGSDSGLATRDSCKDASNGNHESSVSSHESRVTSHESRVTSRSPRLRTILSDSISRHLRADVPMCSLLSGGLDSTMLAAVAVHHTSVLHTYCSGTPASADAPPGDLEFARSAAATLGTRHTEAPISRNLFLERWHSLVASARVPLSTPNEVAINEVARVLRSQGHVVALSGEGADELFAGYEAPMHSAAAFVAQHPNASARDSALFQLADAAWAPLESKPALFNPEVWRAIEHDSALIDSYTDTFAALHAERDDEPLQAHLRFSRRINLAGLLLRLDSATMRESVEGRTPFADVAVADFAESLPMHDKFSPASPATAARTKIALRQAFAPDIPPAILHRPKASFPLPFADWIDAMVPTLLSSTFARDLFTPAALHHVAAQPTQLWRLAWPMINLAMWREGRDS